MIGLENILQLTDKEMFEREVCDLIENIDAFLQKPNNVNAIKSIYAENQEAWRIFNIKFEFSCHFSDTKEMENRNNIIREVDRLYKLNWDRANLNVSIVWSDFNQEIVFAIHKIKI